MDAAHTGIPEKARPYLLVHGQYNVLVLGKLISIFELYLLGWEVGNKTTPVRRI